MEGVTALESREDIVPATYRLVLLVGGASCSHNVHYI